MKKLILILFAACFLNIAHAQRYTTKVTVQSVSDTLTRILPINTEITVLDSSKIYVLTAYQTVGTSISDIITAGEYKVLKDDDPVFSAEESNLAKLDAINIFTNDQDIQASSAPTLSLTSNATNQKWIMQNNSSGLYIEPENANNGFHIRNLANSVVFDLNTSDGDLSIDGKVTAGSDGAASSSDYLRASQFTNQTLDLDVNSILVNGSAIESGVDDVQDLSYGSTIIMDYETSSNGSVTLTGDVTTFTLENVPEGGFGTIEIIQDATGGYGVDEISHTGLTTVYLPGEAPEGDNIDSEADASIPISYWRSTDNLYITFVSKTTMYYPVAISDEETDLITGTGKITFRMPFAATLTGLRASVTTAPTGSNLVIDVNESGSSVLSTKLSIDDGETTSTTAATSYVISDSALADDAEITIDIDQVGSSTAGTGAKVVLYLKK
ncbi:MAG: hypothetical protein ACOC2U_00080 [bacterium]